MAVAIGRLKNKTAIVTGGASGFGSGIVDSLAREGANVFIVDINAGAAGEKAQSVNSAGGKAHSMRVDVSEFDDNLAMVESCMNTFGAVDVLVANAGLGQRPCAIEQTADEDYDRQFAVNVKGVFYNCKAVIPVFKKQGCGNIIITASGIALRPRPNLVIYGASKGAVLNLAKGLALELAPFDIRVNSLCPGPGETPMLAEFMGGTESDEGRESFRSVLPLGKLIRPQDMGEAAVFLADDHSSSRITGLMMPVDSGRTV